MIDSAALKFDVKNLNTYYDEFEDVEDPDLIEEKIFYRSLKQNFLQFIKDYIFMANMYITIFKEIVKVFNKDKTKQTKTKLLANFIITYTKLRRKPKLNSDTNKIEYIYMKRIRKIILMLENQKH